MIYYSDRLPTCQVTPQSCRYLGFASVLAEPAYQHHSVVNQILALDEAYLYYAQFAIIERHCMLLSIERLQDR